MGFLFHSFYYARRLWLVWWQVAAAIDARSDITDDPIKTEKKNTQHTAQTRFQLDSLLCIWPCYICHSNPPLPPATWNEIKNLILKNNNNKSPSCWSLIHLLVVVTSTISERTGCVRAKPGEERSRGFNDGFRFCGPRVPRREVLST